MAGGIHANWYSSGKGGLSGAECHLHSPLSIKSSILTKLSFLAMNAILALYQPITVYLIYYYKYET